MAPSLLEKEGMVLFHCAKHWWQVSCHAAKFHSHLVPPRGLHSCVTARPVLSPGRQVPGQLTESEFIATPKEPGKFLVLNIQ